jgi:hypothetical protein
MWDREAAERRGVSSVHDPMSRNVERQVIEPGIHALTLHAGAAIRT